MKNILKFSSMKDNAKLSHIKNGYVFSLPAGHSCPAAKECLAKVIKVNNKYKIVDGKDQKFRCYAASQEVVYPPVREKRNYNFNLLKKHKSIDEMVDLIIKSIPKNAEVIRVHDSGDMFNENYFRAWMKVAELNPNIIFYAYTKSLHYLNKGIYIPDNFKLNASFGGRYDYLIDELNLKHVKIFFSKEEAEKESYKLDKTDDMAYKQNKSFGLLLHGVQAKNTKASQAWQKIKLTEGGYSKNKPKII